MGSIEVYDYDQMKRVPYVSTPEDAERTYQKIKSRIEEKTYEPGYMTRKLQDTEDKLKDTERKLEIAEAKLKRAPRVNLVTPVAQAIEIAESEVKRATKRSGDYSEGTVDWSKMKY